MQYKVGQIADKDIIAPFNFYVFKTSEAINKERERIAENIDSIYTLSDDIKFSTLTKIDSFIEHLSVLDFQSDVEIAQAALRNNGFFLSESAIELLSDKQVRLQLHNYLIRVFNSILSIGVYGRDLTVESIAIYNNDNIRELPLSRFYSFQESIGRIVNDFQDERLRPLLQEITPLFLTNNIIVDNEKTNYVIQEAYKEIDPALTEVLENEEIIRKNRRITEMDLKKLEAMYSHNESNGSTASVQLMIFSTLGYFLLSLLLIFTGFMLIKQLKVERFSQTNHLIGYLILISILMVLSYAVTKFDNAPVIINPFSLTVIIISLIFTPLAGIIYSVVAFLLVLPFFHWNIIVMSILFLTSLSMILVIIKMKDPHDFVPLSVYTIISFIIVTSIISLLTTVTLTEYLSYLLYGGLSFSLSITGVILISPFMEKKLHLTNKMILLQLLEADNPLLKRLGTETPGTFHHSVTVGVLAESAAESIGANALLARVGSYYHDIGKLVAPEIFIENNSDATKIHEKKEYYKSADEIRNHVSAGIFLARKHKLPEQVIDIIKQHHGDSKVAYFYNKAKEKNPFEDEKKYKYFGPKPETKEAVLVMIADIVESTAKVNMNEHTEDTLKKIIDDTVSRLINEGQLSEAPITLKELETVKSYMLPIIVGIYRKRIDYTESKNKE